MPTIQPQITDATVDKLLGANFLSLALIALVMVVAMFLLFVWMNNRREGANDKRQDVLIKIFTDEKSPLVQSSTHSATAIEIANARSSELTKALVTLGDKTDKQTSSIESQTVVIQGQALDLRNYQTLVSDNLASHSDRIEMNTANIAALKTSIDDLSTQIKAMLEDKSACAGAEEIMRNLRDEVMALITNQKKKSTQEFRNELTKNGGIVTP